MFAFCFAFFILCVGLTVLGYNLGSQKTDRILHVSAVIALVGLLVFIFSGYQILCDEKAPDWVLALAVLPILGAIAGRYLKLGNLLSKCGWLTAIFAFSLGLIGCDWGQKEPAEVIYTTFDYPGLTVITRNQTGRQDTFCVGFGWAEQNRIEISRKVLIIRYKSGTPRLSIR